MSPIQRSQNMLFRGMHARLTVSVQPISKPNVTDWSFLWQSFENFFELCFRGWYRHTARILGIVGLARDGCKAEKIHKKGTLSLDGPTYVQHKTTFSGLTATFGLPARSPIRSWHFEKVVVLFQHLYQNLATRSLLLTGDDSRDEILLLSFQ